MKWVALLLFIANVVFYLWAGSGNGVVEPPGLATPDVNPDGMLLLGEAQTATASENAPRPSPEEARQDMPDLSCYRIGPFRESSGWLAAEQWMGAQQFAYRAVRSERREMRAIRVYLGPFDSADAAKPTVDWLETQGIEHFADPQEPGEMRISLGYFIQEALAARFAAHLLSRGIEANSRVEYRVMGPFDWMEATVDSTARRDLLFSRRWFEEGVAVSKIDCSGISPPAEPG